MSIENGFISSETMSFLFLNDFSGIESIMSFKKQKYLNKILKRLR